MIQIPLYRRDGSVRGYALVDDVDAYLAAHRWTWGGGEGYVFRTPWARGKRSSILLHRVIAGLVLGDGLEADHINGNRLDNRRENLRILTRAENAQNRRADNPTLEVGKRGSSAYRGVSWVENRGKWRARVRVHGKTYSLGNFVHEDEAGDAVQQFLATNSPFFVAGR